LTTPPLEVFVIYKLGFDTVYRWAKFKDSSFSRSRDIIKGPKIKNRSRNPDHAPLKVFCYLSQCDLRVHKIWPLYSSFSRSTDMVNMPTKFYMVYDQLAYQI